MNNQKGITLISIIIYIIVLTIVLSTLSVVSSVFFNNLNYITDRGKYISEFNKFNMYFIEDVKNNTDILKINNNKSEIIFDDGTIYTFKDDSIYRNKIKICKNIKNCVFEERQDNNSGITKKIIKVKINIYGLDNLITSNDYVLKYW